MQRDVVDNAIQLQAGVERTPHLEWLAERAIGGAVDTVGIERPRQVAARAVGKSDAVGQRPGADKCADVVEKILDPDAKGVVADRLGDHARYE